MCWIRMISQHTREATFVGIHAVSASTIGKEANGVLGTVPSSGHSAFVRARCLLRTSVVDSPEGGGGLSYCCVALACLRHPPGDTCYVPSKHIYIGCFSKLICVPGLLQTVVYPLSLSNVPKWEKLLSQVHEVFSRRSCSVHCRKTFR